MIAKLADKRPIVRIALTEVALAIGVSAASADQMVAEGALPPPRKWHSRKLWLVSEVEAYLNERPVDGAEARGARNREFGQNLRLNEVSH